MAEFTDIGASRTDFISPSKRSDVFGIVEKWGQGLIDSSKENLRKSGAVASKSLLQSIRFELTITGSVYNIKLIMEAHGKFVDEGTGPRTKFLPYDPGTRTFPALNQFGGGQAGWLQNKGLRLRDAPPGMSIEKQMRSLAFLVARKIKEEGTKATHFFRDARKQNSVQKLQQDLSRALKRDVMLEVQEIREQIT